MVFLDATGNVDSNNCRMFLLMCRTKCGGVPLGMLIIVNHLIWSYIFKAESTITYIYDNAKPLL